MQSNRGLTEPGAQGVHRHRAGWGRGDEQGGGGDRWSCQHGQIRFTLSLSQHDGG